MTGRIICLGDVFVDKEHKEDEKLNVPTVKKENIEEEVTVEISINKQGFAVTLMALEPSKA